MTDPKALINNLSAALQASDIASGKSALNHLKVRLYIISAKHNVIFLHHVIFPSLISLFFFITNLQTTPSLSIINNKDMDARNFSRGLARIN